MSQLKSDLAILKSLPAGGVCHAKSARRDRLKRLMQELGEPFRVHRKQWEFAIVVEALEAAGLIGSGKRGLGFGVGVEPLVAYLASRGCETVATDLEHGWYENSFARLNQRGLCPPDQFAKLVSMRHVDMNWIPKDLTDFDFCWSCCSMDHLGSIRLGKRFVYHSLRCLKPGGVAVHSGEFNLQSHWHTIDYDGTVLWTRYDVDETLAYLHERGHESAFDWTTGDEPEDQLENQGNGVHIRLMIGEFLATSFGLVIRKGDQSHGTD